MFGYLAGAFMGARQPRSLTGRKGRAMITSARAVLTVAGVAASLVLAGCTGSSSESSSSTVSTSSPAVQSASPGQVAGANHPRTGCEEADDLTASVRLYNEMQVLPIRDFALPDNLGPDASAVWLKQTGSKAFEADDNGEGNYGCAGVPYAVKNGADKTLYLYDGKTWDSHPGWWGHQQSCEWCDAPKGYVDFTCSGPYKAGWQPCVDTALVGDVVARWDATGTAKNDTELTSHPACDTRNAVIGCYLLLPEKSSQSFDFGFETYAWTAPMLVTLSTRFSPEQASYPRTNSADDTKAVKQDIYMAWKVTNPKIGRGEWVQTKSPQGQVVTPKRSPVIGGYAQADQSSTTTIGLRLVPAFFTNQRGEPLNCKRDKDQVVTCTYVKTNETPNGIDNFYVEQPFITVNAALSLTGVSRTSGPPKVEAATITCRSNFTTVNKKNLNVNCNADSEPGRSAYTYGATWQTSITN